MNLRLDGKVALITGGSRGIGKAIAGAYVAAGARVMISSRKAEQLEAAAGDIGGDIAWFAANAGDPEATSACVAATMAHFGAVDILVNNAATNPYMGPLMGLDESRAMKTMQVNQWSVLRWVQEVWRSSMLERGGAVLNIASVGGISGGPTIAWYNTTKAAVIHLTKELAAELGPQVRVNALAPGLVRTEFSRALWEDHGDDAAARLPMRRLGEAGDIAGAAVFLASDAASWITGTTTVIDGGAVAQGGRAGGP
jgi:NAD(P)-dependent dehydrogenase (short-subunit alcohol dehydrogenase family)